LNPVFVSVGTALIGTRGSVAEDCAPAS